MLWVRVAAGTFRHLHSWAVVLELVSFDNVEVALAIVKC